MDLSSILSLLEKANINTNEVQDLIYEASRLDLSNEDNVRSLIRKSAQLANKDISIEKENQSEPEFKEKLKAYQELKEQYIQQKLLRRFLE